MCLITRAVDENVSFSDPNTSTASSRSDNNRVVLIIAVRRSPCVIERFGANAKCTRVILTSGQRCPRRKQGLSVWVPSP
ncbi:hypothetical protein L596_009128 [Steinernema carpocapsae]|uniref:Uncharacterized protein n=1 Tax=Steinernema carpocapsae TaxID=34508 RepID=A0A4U5PEV3_STECR|nr:hypothetical protein L596_009128 [Steinernema carpocapsae]